MVRMIPRKENEILAQKLEKENETMVEDLSTAKNETYLKK